MNGAVVNLRTYQIRKRTRSTLSDRVTQAVTYDFHGYPPDAIEAGIAAANRVVTERGTFAKALTAARTAVIHTAAAASADRNMQRLAQFYARREQRAARLMVIIEQVLRKTLDEKAVAQAMARARRVLDGGGSCCDAVYHAFKGAQ